MLVVGSEAPGNPSTQTTRAQAPAHHHPYHITRARGSIRWAGMSKSRRRHPHHKEQGMLAKAKRMKRSAHVSWGGRFCFPTIKSRNQTNIAASCAWLFFFCFRNQGCRFSPISKRQRCSQYGKSSKKKNTRERRKEGRNLIYAPRRKNASKEKLNRRTQ